VRRFSQQRHAVHVKIRGVELEAADRQGRLHDALGPGTVHDGAELRDRPEEHCHGRPSGPEDPVGAGDTR
jgi:hypothetical protein